MNILKSDALEFIDEHFTSLLSKVETDTSELFSLLDDNNDWAFIIKLSAYIELLLNNALQKRLKEPGLKSLVLSSPLYGRNSKTQLAYDLDVITKSQSSFIQQVVEMRNVCAHDYLSVDFQLSEYITNMDKNQRKAWVRKLNYFEGEATEPMGQLIRDMPKYGLIIGTLILSSTMEVAVMKGVLDRELDKLELKASRSLLDFA
ncbi:hypothetical protein ACP6H9_26615 [Vibrio harveyi]|uniref:hypothetical protein n=2 Tax=Vibrio harveyi TaxID=669 RepID=UPI00215CBDDD|nr:hypothetical protein [Vibrio harveyi]MCR9770308.1 hypothetical protein [Vibrio harveyi]